MNDDTAIIQIQVKRNGVWREIVLCVPAEKALNRAKRALSRRGVVRIFCAGWYYDARDAK